MNDEFTTFAEGRNDQGQATEFGRNTSTGDWECRTESKTTFSSDNQEEAEQKFFQECGCN